MPVRANNWHSDTLSSSGRLPSLLVLWLRKMKFCRATYGSTFIPVEHHLFINILFCSVKQHLCRTFMFNRQSSRMSNKISNSQNLRSNTKTLFLLMILKVTFAVASLFLILEWSALQAQVWKMAPVQLTGFCCKLLYNIGRWASQWLFQLWTILICWCRVHRIIEWFEMEGTLNII